MRQIILLLFCFVACSPAAGAQSSLSFNTVDDVFRYAETHSVTFKNADQQTLLAKYQTLAARLSQWNLKADLNFTMTDNTKLAVNYIPAEIFGGPPGTFRPITLGQQYMSVVSTSPQFDLINPYAMAMVKTAKASEQITRITNLLNKKGLYESVSAAYYNILSYEWQLNALRESLTNADSLTAIMQHKQQEGIARSQDVNNSMATSLSVKDKIQQMEIQLEQEKGNLKLLCDIDAATDIDINVQEPQPAYDASLSANGNLLEQQYLWQKKYQQADLDANKKWFLPTVSFFSNFGWNQYTNNRFWDNTSWLGTNYVGLRFSVPLAPDVTKAATVRYDRINVAMSENNRAHSRLQDSIRNQQAELDYKKAYGSYQLSMHIEDLKKDSYYKNLDIYKEGILSATDMLLSFNDWLNSRIATVTQLTTSEYMKSKIIINNTVK